MTADSQIHPETRARTHGRIGRIALAALAYLVLGLAGLALAIPPGYASPIFPAAGFAVAFMLWSGRRAWPGIALGSLLLNLGAGDLGEAARTATVFSALGIAAGSTAQALFASWLVERVTGQGWRAMESTGGIVRILALAGPLACLVSASFGVGALYFNGLVPAGNVSFTWWNWWAGDTLGVLVALPLSLAWLLRAQPIWRGRLSALWPAMLMALTVIAVGYVVVAKWETARRDEFVFRHGEDLARRLDQRFIAHQEALAALKRLIEVSPDMSYAHFEHFTRITLGENPDIFALSFNPRVRREDRAAFERRMARATPKADFEITERDAERRLIRAGDRPEHVVVGYIAPLQGNLPALGYDINSDPIRQDAIRRARESRRSSITATVQLVQESRKRVGALLLHPAYRAAPGDTAAAATDASLIGFAVGVIKVDEMVEIATRSARVHGLAFRIDDVTGGARGMVFQSEGAAPGKPAATPMKFPMTIADRVWELAVYPTAAYQSANRSWVAWATGIVGLSLAALLQVLLLTVTAHAAVARLKVRQQGEELETQGAELKDRNAQINALFELSPDGFIAIAADGTIRFANPAFHGLTGVAAAECLGRSVGDLDQRLRRSAEQPERYRSLGALFAGDRVVSATQKLALVRPREVVLQIVGVRGTAASVDRFIYFRDITHETEVEHLKSEFLAHAAHELRTPMASIFGFSELLMTQEFDDATRRDLLATIHKQTQWLVDIINELLDLSRIEARRGKDFRIEAVSLASLADEAVAAMNIDPTRWPLSVDPGEKSPLVLADSGKLRQVLSNVLSNAVKYSPAGGAIEIHFATRDGNGKVFVGVSVTDHGIGMTPDQVSHVCERFYRADASGKIPGSGLGMAIVKELVELLGGRVDIVSAPGVGTAVTAWLPAADGTDEPTHISGAAQ
ncbi:CHASE domain-containing protein [Sulfuritalea hydrogenivorans]|uniref:histidine kinase n=1 Tax=Sulfuritalea hydrogenivorans sk43H TaxID=1223802 RepID=W0SFS3_9PROT|nr:CHASE domain-containing protein [Sulfuritalea hydrogenivorans]BAO29625.1 PAS domain S-box [Sulfuritalea hydrogenivorans sk43H]